LIADEENTLVLTAGGYIKRTNPDEYKKQRRGGVGVVDLNTKEEDFVTHFLTASTHSELLFFTDKGKVYQIKMYDIPEGKRATRGKSVMNFISLGAEEKITSILPVPKDTKGKEGLSLMLVTKNGVGKRILPMYVQAESSQFDLMLTISWYPLQLLIEAIQFQLFQQKDRQFDLKNQMFVKWEETLVE